MNRATAKADFVVTGARSVVGRHLLGLLASSGLSVTAISRSERPAWVPAEVNWIAADMRDRTDVLAGCEGVLVHLAKLPLLAETMPSLRHPLRLVAFSTASVETKREGAVGEEAALLQEIFMSEETVIEHARRHGIAATVLRPTMIYDGRFDANVSRLRGFIKRFRFFPLAGGGQGLRQPVHAADVARFCMVLARRQPHDPQVLPIAGDEVITYREMIRRLFVAENLPPRFLPLPMPVAYAGARLAGHLGLLGSVAPEFVKRTGKDLTVDASEARKLGFTPRGFQVDD
ncbi:MAG TPA: NAD-dependent epimerase/dehydratase family protein [Gammaproteobacteria bacterium]